MLCRLFLLKSCNVLRLWPRITCCTFATNRTSLLCSAHLIRFRKRHTLGVLTPIPLLPPTRLILSILLGRTDINPLLINPTPQTHAALAPPVRRRDVAFLAFDLDLDFLPPGVTFPLHTALAYIFAYALGYTLNFRFAAALPRAQSFAISIYHFLQDQ